MKLILTILFFGFQLQQPIAKPGIEEIPFEEINLGCHISGGSTYYINSLEEFKKLWKDHANCYAFDMPKIDFEKYSLIGYQTSSGGCEPPIFNQKILKDNFTNVYEITIQVTEKGLCKALFQIYKWSLVPKINSSIGSVHFNIKKNILPESISPADSSHYIH